MSPRAAASRVPDPSGCDGQPAREEPEAVDAEARPRRPASPARSAPRRRGGGARIYRKPSPHTGIEYFYGDFRRFGDVGGRLEPLRADGARTATTDPDEASKLYAARLAHYEAAREALRRAPAEAPAAVAPAPVRLGPFLREHLAWKAAQPGVRLGTVERDEDSFKVLVRVLGNGPLGEVTPGRLEAYVAQRRGEPGTKRGSMTAERTIRNELHSLSHAFRRAVMLGHVLANPVQQLVGKPQVPTDEAVFLEEHEAAAFLDAAEAEDRETAALLAAAADAEGAGRAAALPPATVADARRGAAGRQYPTTLDRIPFVHAIVAAFLHTGGRVSEVLGLRVTDIDFARSRVYFRPNRWRTLKRAWHVRSVQLWPALAAVLRAHVAAYGLAGDDLVFPSFTGRPITRFGKALDRCAARVGAVEKRVVPHSLRHTFATMLLQTLVPTADGGWAARSSFDVAKQLGHRTSKLVDTTYGHAVENPVYRRELRYEAARGEAPAAGARS